MGKKHNGSLIYQLNKRMNSMFTPGASRHADKQTGADKGRIYSYNTYNTYKKECSNFCKFLKKEGIKDINNVNNNHVIKYLQEKGGSAYSQQTRKSALNKVFNTSVTREQANIGLRTKANITRSRNEAKMDSKYSLKFNSDKITIAKATGIRRSSMLKLTPNSFSYDSKGNYCVTVTEKGGKTRQAVVLKDKVEEVKAIVSKNNKGNNIPLFNKYSKNIDNHAFRSEYCNNLLKEVKENGWEQYQRTEFRDNNISTEQKELLVVSQNMGHNRIDVIQKHYLK